MAPARRSTSGAQRASADAAHGGRTSAAACQQKREALAGEASRSAAALGRQGSRTLNDARGVASGQSVQRSASFRQLGFSGQTAAREHPPPQPDEDEEGMIQHVVPPRLVRMLRTSAAPSEGELAEPPRLGEGPRSFGGGSGGAAEDAAGADADDYAEPAEGLAFLHPARSPAEQAWRTTSSTGEYHTRCSTPGSKTVSPRENLDFAALEPDSSMAENFEADIADAAEDPPTQTPRATNIEPTSAEPPQGAAEKRCELLAEELTALRAEAEASAEAAAATAQQERKTAEDEREKVKDELRTHRREATLRFRRHTEDVEALSSALCDARSRCAAAEGALDGARNAAQAAAQQSRADSERCAEAQALLREEAVELTALRKMVADLEASVCSRRASVAEEHESEHRWRAALVAELRASREENEDLEASHASVLAALRTELCNEAGVASLETAAAKREATAAVWWNEESSASSARAKTAQRAEEEEAALAASLRAQLDKAEGDARSARQTVSQLSESRELAKAAGAKVARLQEDLDVAQARSRELFAQEQSLAAARDRSVGYEELHANLDSRLALLEGELYEQREMASEERACWSTEKAAMVEAEEEAIGAAEARGRAAATSELTAVKNSRTAALADLKKTRQQVDALRAEMAEGLEEAAAAAGLQDARLAVEASELQASEAGHAALREQLAALTSQLTQAGGAEAASMAWLRTELGAEASECAEQRRQAAAARAQVAKLQEAARARKEEDEELLEECAMYKARAMRDARSATELRAEMAETRLRMSKQSIAAKELGKASDEADGLRLELREAVKAREAAQNEATAGRQRQSTLERQLQILEARLTERPGASAATTVTAAPQGGGLGGLRAPAVAPPSVKPPGAPLPSSGDELPPTASEAASFAAPPLRRFPSLGRAPSLGALAPPPVPSMPASLPEMPLAAAQQLGPLRTPPSGRTAVPQSQSSGSLGSLGVPPRPPQAAPAPPEAAPASSTWAFAAAAAFRQPAARQR
eukprot:TRINITY_DN5617_c0_g1_i2.p1 TRINITY_DN5617_c0_g1~~TRINITY_DN5617_c0_g1_i2.p1  ORF type:complete len:1006 (+),score=288.34 TRINITY_DN5617_c0_g1_i2:174-3191(+)